MLQGKSGNPLLRLKSNCNKSLNVTGTECCSAEYSSITWKSLPIRKRKARDKGLEARGNQ